MERLKKESKQFHDVIFYIWQLLAYYADYFGYDAPESAHQLRAKLFRDGTLTKIRVSVPRIKDYNTPYSVENIRVIMNEYLQLLLQDSTLPPFAADSSYHETIEPLFITIIVTNGLWYDMDFLWIDNLDAYRTVTENRMENIMRII